jgi:hypothetical protein
VNLVDEVPIRLLHVLEADISKNAGIVDENVDTTEGVDGCFDNGLAILDGIVVGNRFTACGADLFDDLVGGLWKVLSAAAQRVKHVKRDIRLRPRHVEQAAQEHRMPKKASKLMWRGG